MKKSIVVVDDFYDNPMTIRNFALNQNFNITGNYPGHRTESLINEEAEEKLSSIVKGTWGDDVDFPRHEGSYQGCYQHAVAWEKSWIHYDHWNEYACVIYLTPDAPLHTGTALYKHKATGITEKPDNDALCERLLSDGRDYTKWDITDRVGNIFNRAIIYPGNKFHSSIEYFGFDKYTGRLFQTFFFNKI
jgi:hypothetical protein